MTPEGNVTGVRRVLSVIAIVLLAAGCSGDDAGPSTTPTAAPQSWQYTQLYSISSTFLDSLEPGLSRPDGFDATGAELWNRYRDAQVTVRELSSDADDQQPVTELIDATKAVFVHLYSTGTADEMIARDIEESPGIVVEGAMVPFENGRPAAVGELDLVLQRDGCDEIEDGYYVWLGQTTIDEISGRASLFARYAIDQAAAAGCEWAFIELVEHALNISGID